MSSDTLQSLGAAMSRNELTSEALVRRLLARAEAAEPVLHAFTKLLGEHALSQARALDAERHAGQVRGPLHGLPIVLKDVFDVARQPTTGGSRLYADNFAAADATVVSRLLDSGVIVLGKTQLVELAFGGWGTNSIMGTPRNPWDLATHRAPGGSSSGTAVAVAAGMAPAGIGTDTGGSVRIPAALCGVVGLKTTAGLVPREGVMLLSQTLDTVGPLTHTVADARLLFEVLSGAAHRGDNCLPARPRIGILTSRDIDDIDGDVLAAYDGFVGHLGDMGASLTEFAFGDTLDYYVERMSPIIACEGWHAHGLRILQNPDYMDPYVRARFLKGQRISSAHYQAALAERAVSMGEMLKLLERFDALLTPTTPIPAPPLTEIDEGALPLSRYTRLVNYLGLCALAVPAGLGAGGLPVSAQLIGKPGSEALLLALGEELEQRRGPFPAPDLGLLCLP